MAIQSESELEAVLNRVVIKLEKHIAERGSWPVVEEVKRTIEAARAASRSGPKLKALREKLRTASETCGSEIPLDSPLLDDMWDIEDYVDYRA